MARCYAVAMTQSPVTETQFERPILTVDAVVMTVQAGRLMVALVRRAAEPHIGELALPGGYVRLDTDIDADAAVRRVLSDKTGLTPAYVEQLRTFSGPKRDPRGWSVSVAYIALLSPDPLARPSRDLVWQNIDDVGPLPFDHSAIIAAARDRLRTKGAYSTLPARLLPDHFTLPEMQQIYELAIGSRLDQSSFRRKIAELGAVEPVDGQMRQSSIVRRPAQLYRLAEPIALFDKRF